MRYAGKTVCLVMCNGDIIAAYEDDDEAEGKAFAINNNNADAAAREAGYDPDDLSDSEAAEFAFKGGFDGYAYVEYVQIPEEDEEDNDEDDDNFSRVDEDSEFYTSEGDTLTYGDVISAIDAMYANEEDDEPEEDDEDSDEDDEDSDEDDSDEDDDPDYYI